MVAISGCLSEQTARSRQQDDHHDQEHHGGRGLRPEHLGQSLDHTEAEAAQAQNKEATQASGSKSRSDGFWTTFGKQVIRSVVPAATRMLEQQIKRGTLGGIRRGRGSGGF